MKFEKRPFPHIVNKMIWVTEDQFAKLDKAGWFTLATKEDVDNIYDGTKICEHPVTKELYKVGKAKNVNV